MLNTRTGSFPIGFRRGWSEWQRDLPSLCTWATANGFQLIDLGNDADDIGRTVVDAGLGIGSADLKSWQAIISPDSEKRKRGADENLAYIEACAKFGIKNFFAVMLPEDPSKPRRENHELMVDGLSRLLPGMDTLGAKLVLEGWPGPGALCCTPESYRAAIDDCKNPALGINYDPSHLLRMGIDPVRFVQEFVASIHHVHGKDTEIFAENVYEYGTEQGPTKFGGYGFGGATWRYTIPGHGQVRWVKIFEILKAAGYKGGVSIELEDQNFNGSTEGERNGLLFGGRFLQGC